MNFQKIGQCLMLNYVYVCVGSSSSVDAYEAWTQTWDTDKTLYGHDGMTNS